MMIKVFVDGVYKEFTPEEYEAQFGGDVEAPRPEPTAEERLAALEAAVADLALQNLPAEVKADA